MRLILIASMSFLLFCNRAEDARSKQKMLDPLFGIAYDPQQVHFEVAPEAIGQLCPGYREKRMWVYAHYQGSGTEYFIVSFFMKFYPDGRGPASIAPDPGTVIALHGKECLDDQSEWVMMGRVNPANRRPIIVDETVLDGLASDALERYTKAFGGKQKFLAALNSNSSPGDIAPVLEKHLEQFMNQSSVRPEPAHGVNLPGELVIMQPVPALRPDHQQGHIAVYDGSQWISDYTQGNFQPY